MSRKSKLAITVISAILLAAIVGGTALASADWPNYLWKNRFYTVYSGYNAVHKNHVKAVQQITSAYPGCLGLSIDGVFGPNTTTNVRTFQSARGLGVDGRVGPNTWTSLQYRIYITRQRTDEFYYKIKTDANDMNPENFANDSYEFFKHTSSGSWYYQLYDGSGFSIIR